MKPSEQAMKAAREIFPDEEEYIKRRRALCEKLREHDIWKSFSKNGIKKQCKPFLIDMR